MTQLAIDQLAQTNRELAAALQGVRSTRDLERHSEYRANRDWIEKCLKTFQIFPPSSPPQIIPRDVVRVCAWNVERGLAFEGIADTLKSHPLASDWDICLVTEVDFGMARSKNRHVARELGEALGCYTVFGPAFLNLDKGNGSEGRLAVGENTAGLQGHAIFSRYPISDVELVPLPNPKDHVATKERQIGCDQAIVATVHTPQGPLHCACIHLSAHSSREHRVRQMREILKVVNRRPGPALLGGDWNTTTYNAHRAVAAILGFWRRVAMGVHHVMKNHYPYPENFFERKLFRTVEAEGFSFGDFNVAGGCTLHYDFNDAYVRDSLNDWIPDWCFPYIDRVLKPHDGKFSFKLDWFAGRDVEGGRPTIVRGLPAGLNRYSDHDPILVDLRLKPTPNQKVGNA